MSSASESPGDFRDPRIRFLRWCALLAWSGFVLSVALLWIQHRVGVMHPQIIAFISLLLITFLSGFIGLVAGMWRPRSARALWAFVAFIPVLLWTTLAILVLRCVILGQAWPKNVVFDIAGVASATVMEGQAALAYPYRLESDRLVMFYDDRVSNPQADIDEMERHVADLEAKTGAPLRAKIHWVRGEIFGRRNMAIRGLTLGSSASPANWETADHPLGVSVDRHELAHAVIHQFQPGESDPPTLLIEGWAEALSGTTKQKRAEFALHSRSYWRERTTGWEQQSYLLELTGPDWYRKIDGPVYNVGGALADFILEKYGAERFLGFYCACRPDRFPLECEAQLGVEFAGFERGFWDFVEQRAGKARDSQK